MSLPSRLFVLLTASSLLLGACADEEPALIDVPDEAEFAEDQLPPPLQSGEARLNATLTRPNGTMVTIDQTIEDATVIANHGFPGDLTWGVWFRLDTVPDGSVFAYFYDDDRASELSAGSGQLRGAAVDIFDIEHGGDTQDVGGDMVITYSQDGIVSGYLEGEIAQVPIYSHMTLQLTGYEVQINSLEFNEIEGEHTE